jgi:hypothetical protein
LYFILQDYYKRTYEVFIADYKTISSFYSEYDSKEEQYAGFIVDEMLYYNFRSVNYGECSSINNVNSTLGAKLKLISKTLK